MNVIICGNYGIGNLGDEAILDGMINIVKTAHPHADITVLSSNPEHTIKHHNVKAVMMFPAGFRSLIKGFFSGSLFKTLHVIKKANIFILGGGGLFTDEKLKACFIWWIQAKIALLLGKPLYLFGQSVGPLKTKTGKYLALHTFKRAKIIAVRDEKSKETLEALGITDVKILTDTAFAIPLEKALPDLSENYLVLSVRSWPFTNKQDLSNFCVHFVDWAYKKHLLKTYFLPFQDIQNSDSQELNYIFTHLNNREAAKLIPYKADYKSALEIMAKAKLVIGMRLHSIIFSTLCKKPFIALSYSSKVADFCDSLQMSDYVISTANLDQRKLEQCFEKILKDYASIKTHLTGMEMLFRKKAESYSDFLK